MHTDELLGSTQRIGAGLAFIVFPLVFVFAFAVHPGLLQPRLLGPSELILRARGNELLQFAHALVLLWGIVLLPIGFGVQAVALLKSKAIARWQGWLFLIGVLTIATPDGVEAVNLTASVLLAVAFVPYGLRIIRSPIPFDGQT